MLLDNDIDILTEARYQVYVLKALNHAKFVINNWNGKYWNLVYQPYFLYINFYLFNEDEYKDIPYKLDLAIEREADEREFTRFAEKVYNHCKRLKVTKFTL